ncbi:conserved Plasmodium protein, unknown function [Plasmodium vinckei lentum]|uniref:Uncharacterized protein n=1 Tax=Plasmodium vinckei lentum TaxID=138297 RepID=A0A6V7S375_PLAVN|nr:conserved Plasmodium protein, unknown function [Plasmodium vinckei lentum]
MRAKMKNRLIKDNVENKEMCDTKKKSKDQVVIDYVYKNIFNKSVFLNIFKRNNYNDIGKNKTITKKDINNIDIEKRKEEIKNYKKEINDNEEYLLFLSYVYNDLISFIENDKEYHLKNSEFSDIEDLIIDICGNICHKSFNNIKKIFIKSQKDDEEEVEDHNNVYTGTNDKCLDEEINKNVSLNEPSFFFIPPMEYIVSHIYKLNSNLNKNDVRKEKEDVNTFIKNNNYDKKCDILNNILNNEQPLKGKEDDTQNEIENKTNKKKKNSTYVYLSKVNDKSLSNSSQNEVSDCSLEKEAKINDHKFNDSIFEYPYKETNESSDYTHDSDGYNSSSQDEFVSESANSLETISEQICNKKSRQNESIIPNELSKNEIIEGSDFNENILYNQINESEMSSKHADNLSNCYSLKGYDPNSLFSKDCNIDENIKHNIMCSNNNKNITSNTIAYPQENKNDHTLKDENDIYSNGFKNREIQSEIYSMNTYNNENQVKEKNEENSVSNMCENEQDFDKISINHSIHKSNESEFPENFITPYEYQESEHKDIDTYKCSIKEEGKDYCHEKMDTTHINQDDDNNSIACEEIKRIESMPSNISPIETQNILGTYENAILCEDNNIVTDDELAKVNSNKLTKYTNYGDTQIDNVCINYEEKQNNIKENVINDDDKIKMYDYDIHSFENKQLIIKHNEYYEKLNKMLINKKEQIYKEQKEYTKNNNLHDDYYYFKYVNTYENNLNPYCYTKILKKANIQITRSPFPQFLRDIQIYNIPTKKIRLKKTNIALKTENENKTHNNGSKRNKGKKNKKKEAK